MASQRLLLLELFSELMYFGQLWFREENVGTCILLLLRFGRGSVASSLPALPASQIGLNFLHFLPFTLHLSSLVILLVTHVLDVLDFVVCFRQRGLVPTDSLYLSNTGPCRCPLNPRVPHELLARHSLAGNSVQTAI